VKNLSTVILIFFCFGLAVGCKSPEKPKQAFFYETTDSYGRHITLENEPQRIVSLSPSITEVIYLIGAQDKLVGVTDFCDYPPEVQNKTRLGGLQNINFEALLSVHPDVVLISSIVTKKDVDKIEKMGIPVIAIKEEKRLEGMCDVIRTVGQISNHRHKADSLANDWQQRISRLKADNQKTGAPTKSVYYVVGFGDAGDFTAPKDTHIHEIITLAGGRNIGEKLSGWNISREYLFECNPDIILIRKEDYERFCQLYPYNQLKAVKQHHVYPINSGWIDAVSPRNLKAVELISTSLSRTCASSSRGRS